MDKMRPDAFALNRPTESHGAPASQLTRRAHRVAMAGFQATSPVATPVTQAPAFQTGAQQRRTILARAVQMQVIPQLLNRSALRAVRPGNSVGDHIKRLASLSLQGNSHEVIDFVTGLMDNGFDAESLFLDLLTPTAVLLGDYWIEDECTFADVTIGVGHLQTAMRALRPAFFSTVEQIAPGAPRAILMPLPGEQHTFGLSMLSAFFTRAGWDTWSGTVADSGELAAMMRRDWIDLIGLSLSHDALLDSTRHHIARIRAVSRNPGITIMVGGLPFAQDSTLAASIGADGTALDGADAVIVAARLLKRRSGLL